MRLITGKHGSIREMEASDAPLIVAWRNQPEVARWLVQWEPLTVEKHLAWFSKARESDLLMIFEDAAGCPIGTGAFYDFDRQRTSCEWGRLCAAEKCAAPFAMLEGIYLAHRIAFEALGVRRLNGGSSTANATASRLGDLIGYVHEGTRRKSLLAPDGYRDVYMTGMFPEEFAVGRKRMEALLYLHQDPPEITEEDKCRVRAGLARLVRRTAL